MKTSIHRTICAGAFLLALATAPGLAVAGTEIVAPTNFVTGTAAADKLTGSNGTDRIQGLAGDDTIYAGLGRDFVYGGEGNDLINVTGALDGSALAVNADEQDYVDCGPGSDTVVVNATKPIDRLVSCETVLITSVGTEQNDTIFEPNTGTHDVMLGLGGSDRLEGRGADDFLYGGDGSDSLLGGDQNDKLYGEAGDDSLQGENGNDELIGGAGDDTLHGGAGDDTLTDMQGRNVLQAGDGDDTIATVNTLAPAAGHDSFVDCGEGADVAAVHYNDVIGHGCEIVFRYWLGSSKATNADNTFNGGSENDILHAMAGDDRLDGNGGNDTLRGEAGKDTIRGGAGNDTLSGEQGKDLINGASGNDLIVGGAQDDWLVGEAGDDTIVARDGNGGDIVQCGPGNDTVYADRSDSIGNGCEHINYSAQR